MVEINNIQLMNYRKPFLVAEAGINHNGELKKAFSMIEVAKQSGVDAVKFQTFKAENLVSKNAQKAEYQKKTSDVLFAR